VIGSTKPVYNLPEILRLARILPEGTVYLEAFASFALGTATAASLVRCITAWEIGCLVAGRPLQIVKAQTWQKVCFEGTDAKMKTKERARIASDRLFGAQIADFGDGPRDAALIAWWGMRN
jgi:hypothetical protein